MLYALSSIKNILGSGWRFHVQHLPSIIIPFRICACLPLAVDDDQLEKNKETTNTYGPRGK